MRKGLLLFIILILSLPGVSVAFEAPTPYPEKIRHDVELFLNVYDAVFDAKRTKSKRALELWDSLVDHETYTEVNLERPFEFWNWKQARTLIKDSSEQAHSALAEGTITDPQKALLRVSKIDGYRLGTGGELFIYTRYVRTYNKKNRFGLAMFKIRNANAPLKIKKWNEPPYTSNWKICELHWKPITQPEYNKKVFRDYPLLDW